MVEGSVDTLIAKYIGYLPLRDAIPGAPLLGLGKVNGVAISPAGHLFVDFEKAYGGYHGTRVDGVLGFDPLLGRGVKYFGLDITGSEWPQGLEVVDNSLRVAIWDEDYWSNDEYSVWGFTPTDGEKA